MPTLIIFIKAWIIGVAIAAPVGPIGILCIRKTLELGIIGALSIGLGAALADAFYGLIVGIGLTAISHFLLENLWHIKLIGGILLLYLAVTELKDSNASKKLLLAKKSTLQLTTTTFFLTLSNPMTILSFLGIFPVISDINFSFREALVMIAGIFLGSLCWWLILGSIVSYSKRYLPDNLLVKIRLFSALILAVFGLWAFTEAILKIFN